MHCRKPTNLTVMVGFEAATGDDGTVLRILKDDSYLSGYRDLLYDLKVEEFNESRWKEIAVPIPDGSYGLVIEGYVHTTSLSELVIDYIYFPNDCVLDEETKNSNTQFVRTGKFD